MTELNEIPPADREHYMQCPECHQFYDKRDPTSVTFHTSGRCLITVSEGDAHD